MKKNAGIVFCCLFLGAFSAERQLPTTNEDSTRDRRGAEPSDLPTKNLSAYWLTVTPSGGDDSRAILAAVSRAIARGQHGGNTVYFPPSQTCFNIASPLTLPPTPYVRVTLLFDSRVCLNNTLTIRDGYDLKGISSGGTAFADDSLAAFDMGWGFSPAVHIQGNGVHLENIDFAYMHGKSDGIVVDHSAGLKLKNVWMRSDAHNLTGVPLKITGGFGYYIDGGGFSAPNAHSIVINDDPRCNWTGIFRMRDTFFANRGIFINEACGGTNSLSFENILFESAQEPFVTISSRGGNGVWGLDFRGVNFADSVSPLPLVHVAGIRVHNISIINCRTDFEAPMVNGDPATGVNVW
jgi:hypothetical protein